jgi:hypothetical protein
MTEATGQAQAPDPQSNYVEKMGRDLGELFEALSSELAWVHWRWKQYRILFGEKPSQIDLLNESAPLFFRIVHDTLYETTLLGISRLVDRPETMNKQNLTMQRLPPLISDQPLQIETLNLIEKARNTAAFAIDQRNRFIAHRDLKLALGKDTQALEEATRGKVEKSLSALWDVLDRIESAYCKAHSVYDFTPSSADARALLYVIRDGLQRAKERRERWSAGKRHENDINPPGDV